VGSNTDQNVKIRMEGRRSLDIPPERSTTLSSLAGARGAGRNIETGTEKNAANNTGMIAKGKDHWKATANA
jgi:hypothetical protein